MTSIELLREYRVGDYAIFDFVASFIGIYFLSPLLTKLFRVVRLEVSKSSWMYFTLPVSILSHVLVGNITPMTKNFISFDGHITLKIFISLLFLLGIKGVKKIK